jgi:hypothetical protein
MLTSWIDAQQDATPKRKKYFFQLNLSAFYRMVDINPIKDNFL